MEVLESLRDDTQAPAAFNLPVACRRDNVSGHERCSIAVCSAAMENELVKRTLIGNDFTATGH
jgi:hypothetical protein